MVESSFYFLSVSLQRFTTTAKIEYLVRLVKKVVRAGQRATHLTEEHEIPVPPEGLLGLGPEGGEGVAVHQVLEEQ